MRKVIDPQLQFGEQDIAAIHLDPKSRDDIPQILCGLQYIYTTPELREAVFAILEEVIPQGVEGKASPDTGRPGMEQWKILVLGALRRGSTPTTTASMSCPTSTTPSARCSATATGRTRPPTSCRRSRTTCGCSPRRFSIGSTGGGTRRACAGKKKSGRRLNARCDSFVLETDVHFPTDTNLLFDAIRKTIETCADLAGANGLSEWRQSAYNIRQFKKLYRLIQRLRHSTSKDEDKREAKRTEIEEAHGAYLAMAEGYLLRAHHTRACLQIDCLVPSVWLEPLDGYMAHAERQIDQIRRRVLQGETIPHAEKVFSIFQPHTEWIVKGKAGVPMELGLRVCVVEDQHGFILHHEVMEKTTDDRIAVAIVRETKARFSELSSVSFDKGFHSPQNQAELEKDPGSGGIAQEGQVVEGGQGARVRPGVYPPAPQPLGGGVVYQCARSPRA